MGRLLWLFVLACAFAGACTAQFMTTLQPRTVIEFDAYAHQAEADLQKRWNGQAAFLEVDENPVERAKVMHGELWIAPANPNDPVSIDNGLVHDWVGAVYIPRTDVRTVLNLLQDFNRHSQVYPDVKESRLLSRRGDNIVGLWRLERKQGLISVVLDVTQDAHWQQVRPGEWFCRAYARKIEEVERTLVGRQKVLPVGRGRGFLWRLYAYWTLEAINGGVLAECRTLSLSRDIPPSVAWAIEPFVATLPREALAGTLRDTRAALLK